MIKRLILTVIFAGWRSEMWANPSGMSVTSGAASATASGSHLTVTAGNGAVLNWGSFNIGKGETTQFVQPSANAIVLNTIGGTVPSQIWGHLNANGTVVLANPFGFYFGPHSMIKVGGNFIATTAPLPPDAGLGAAWQFTVPPPAASIVNYGEIQAGPGRSLFLISEQIENHGSLKAPGGNVGLYAGQEVLVSERADGRGLSATVTLPAGSIDDSGSVNTTPGALALSEQVVNKQNVAAAATAQVLADGTVDLVAANITLGASSANGAQNVNTAFQGATGITLQASSSITLNTGTVWNLSSSTGKTTGQLTLEAGNNITLNNNSQIVDANNWSVNMQAGGGISLNGNSVVQTGSGGISMNAGQGITVGSGAIRTTGGGSINLTAGGDINAGTLNNGYVFSLAGYTPATALGQIATAAGGDVSLTAGGNIISSPTVPAGQTPGATGAYGPEAGNVTLNAGGEVLGNYTVANGTGTINAGDVGTSQKPVALNLINGSWKVNASDDVFLSEIRNPNGTFNSASLPVPAGQYSGDPGAPVPNRTPFLFDYGDDASASITAGDAIVFKGQNLPRQANDQNMGPIYPPILSLDAGAGGITVDTPITLFPSTQGALSIATQNGGDLIGATAQSTLTGITMSDSGLPGWATFAQGHATAPLHLNDPDPVTLTISGDIQSFGLTVPTFADISVAGNAYNFGFQGQNLSPNQTTEIAVAGSITYRGDLTSVPLSDALPSVLYNLTESGDPQAVKGLSYSAATQSLTYIGQMSQTAEAFLLAPYRIVGGKTIPIALSADQVAAIQQLFAASQTASLGDQGLALAGPGKFDITASSMDLGISGGISVAAPDAAPDAALAAISPKGATVNLNVAGDLEMTASKIADSGYLGGINLNVGGTLNVGGEFSGFGDPNSPKGIFTTSGGAVNVTAGGDVNVNGSRIAAYDGGNITVDSLNGGIDAGSGGSGYVGLQSLFLNRSGNLTAIAATIPGSGILATTVPGSPAQAGSITIDAPHGDVLAGAGGVILIPYNGNVGGGNVTINANPDVNSKGSGIINLGGGTTKITAVNVYGLVVTRGQTQVTAQKNVNATIFSGLGASVSAGGSVSGTVISGGAVDVSGDSISAAVMGEAVSASGNTATASIGLPAATGVNQAAKTTDDTPSSLANSGGDATDDENKKKNKKAITLAEKSSRVTVLMPDKKN